jgi:Flp pilus assembly protein TadD
MEVAVNHPANRIMRCVASAGAALVLALLAGCGDMLTYGQDAKHEGIRQYNDARYAEAVGDFRNSVRQDPTDAEAEYYLGLSYEQVGSYHEAIDAYKTALKLLPPETSPRFSRAVKDGSFERLARVVAQNDPSSTETDLIVKTAGDQRSAEQYRLLGRIFRYKGDADTAMAEYRQSVQLDPDNFGTQKEFGLYLSSLGQAQDAGVVLRDAYRLNQGDKDVNGALTAIGMEPGPSLMAQNPAKPLQPPNSTDNNGLPASIKSGPQSDASAPRD